MKIVKGKAAQNAQVFQEIPGESVSDRRVRYWKWKRLQAKLAGRQVEYGRSISGNKKPTITHLTSQLRELTRQVEAMRSELAKHGYTIPVGE